MFFKASFAIASAGVSRLSTLLIIIVAARSLPSDDFGAFVLVMAIYGIINALISGGGDMWLNPFTRHSSGVHRAPYVSTAYLLLCAIMALAAMAIAALVFGVGERHGLDFGSLGSYRLAALIGVLAAAFGGLTEAFLAVFRASGRVQRFFVVRDLAIPLVLLAVFVALRPDDAVDAIAIYAYTNAAAFVAVAALFLSRNPVPGGFRLPHKRGWNRLIVHTAGLVYGNFSSRLAAYVDVFMVASATNLAQVGAYRVAAQFATGFLVVQHFVFLALPWQMRHLRFRDELGSQGAAVEAHQRLLLVASSAAVGILLVLADHLMALLGESFAGAADIFRLFVLLRFANLLWGPNHELLVSGGLAIRDANVNVASIAGWIVAFAAGLAVGLDAISAAVTAAALAMLLANTLRLKLVRHARLEPVFGQPFGATPAVILTLLIAAGAAIVL